MDVLPLSFHIFQHVGLWRDVEEVQPFYKAIYKSVIVLLLFYVVAGGMANLAYLNNVSEITESLLLLLTYAVLFWKVINFVWRRRVMLDLLGNFRSPICKARSTMEKKLLKNYSKNAARVHMIIISFSYITATGITLSPLFTSEHQLPLKTHQPFDMSSDLAYYGTYAVQILTQIYATAINISFDTMTYGFLILATGQFDLCCQRILDFQGDFEGFKRYWISHHRVVLETIRKIEYFYDVVIAPVFFSNLIRLCACVYQVSQMNTSLDLDFAFVFMFFIWLLSEVFLYCWLGSELLTKSQDIVDAVYSSNWIERNPRSRKDIILTMMIAHKGSRISCHGRFSLCMDTFVWIQKTSYGAYNLLKAV